jgi:hypothetical protein
VNHTGNTTILPQQPGAFPSHRDPPSSEPNLARLKDESLSHRF